MSAVASWLTREHWLIGASLVRIALGTCAIYYYVLHVPVRGFLWGPDGIWPYERFLSLRPFLTVWQLGSSPLFFEVVYAGAIGIALAYTLGWWPRLMGVLHWWMVWSLQERNPFITDGGDNITRIALLFLAFANTGAYLVAGRRPASPPRTSPTLQRALAVVHNVAVLLVLAQLCMLYMSTGLYKAMGELWQQGTALYYVLRVGEYSWPGVVEGIYRNPYLVVFGTYATVVFELMFPPALLSRWLRYAAILAGIVFHTGIGLVMGLVTFAWSMLGLYPLLVTDDEYRCAARWIRRRLALVVLYDGWCPACTRSVRWLCALDPFALVDYVSLRDAGALQAVGLDAERATRRMQSVARGAVAEGIDTLIRIFIRSPLLWPLVPIAVAGRLVGGQRVYDALAARRLVVAPGACTAHCAVERGRTGQPGG